MVCGGLWWFACIVSGFTAYSHILVVICGGLRWCVVVLGFLRWFVVVYGGLRWFAVIWGGLSFRHTETARHTVTDTVSDRHCEVWIAWLSLTQTQWEWETVTWFFVEWVCHSLSNCQCTDWLSQCDCQTHVHCHSVSAHVTYTDCHSDTVTDTLTVTVWQCDSVTVWLSVWWRVTQSDSLRLSQVSASECECQSVTVCQCQCVRIPGTPRNRWRVEITDSMLYILCRY